MQHDLQIDVHFGYASGFKLDIQLPVQKGVITKLIGPSGSGKSSILSLVSGFLHPTKGSIIHGDRVLFSSERAANLKPWERNVGMLFQSETLFPHMSIKQNLLFGSKQKPNPPWDFDSICKLFEIGDLLDRKPSQLSGGQRDRVSLGRALLSQPKILLLDEPLNSVESPLRKKIIDFIATGIAELGIPTLMVSHDSSMQADDGSPIYCMKDGTVSLQSAQSRQC